MGKINKIDNINEVTNNANISDVTPIDDFNLTSTPYINRKYKEFYEKNGYIPRVFNAYNCYEITDIAPTIIASCGNATGTSSILIIEE